MPDWPSTVRNNQHFAWACRTMSIPTMPWSRKALGRGNMDISRAGYHIRLFNAGRAVA